MTQQRPSCLLLAAVALLVSVAAGACIVYVLAPAARGQRPADLTPTPAPTIPVTVTVLSDPTRPVVSSPTPSPEPTEAILANTRVPPTPTDTPQPTATSTAESTKKPPEEMRQRG